MLIEGYIDGARRENLTHVVSILDGKGNDVCGSVRRGDRQETKLGQLCPEPGGKGASMGLDAIDADLLDVWQRLRETGYGRERVRADFEEASCARDDLPGRG